MKGFIVTGTDTEIGKTVFSAALTLALKGTYFKPVQSGLEEETDTARVQRLTGLPDDHFLPEAYRLNTPASPHLSAELDGVEIDCTKLAPQAQDLTGRPQPLIAEGAGGLLVPLTRDKLTIDAFKDWGLPVILCARTALGTINHSLLSVEALKARNIPIHGIAFIGDKNADSERTIIDFAGVKKLGRLPILADINPDSLSQAFDAHFDMNDFQ